MHIHQRGSKHNRGFSVIELLVVMAILAILASVAIPTYERYVIESRRADAIDAIMGIQLEQEKFRGNCIEYARGLADSEVCNNTTPANNRINYSATSRDGHYALALSDAGATGYTITATPQGSQQDDVDCYRFVLTVAGGTAIPSNKDSSDGTVSDTVSKQCWQR